MLRMTLELALARFVTVCLEAFCAQSLFILADSSAAMAMMLGQAQATGDDSIERDVYSRRSRRIRIGATT